MSEPAGARIDRSGVWLAILAYALWGAFPLYFAAMAPADAWEILAHRIVWTLVTCAVVLAVRRDWAWLRSLVRRPALSLGVVAAAYLIAVNWGTYVWAVRAGRTTDAALGYFLNPLATVTLGVVVLRERLRVAQWVAVAIGVAAAGYLTLAAGGLPWVSLTLALSFALYGLLKKKVGGSLTPWQSLAGETAALVPAAAVLLAIVQRAGHTTFGHGTGHTILLVSAGVVTAVPLLLFAAAAHRIPLSVVGLIQFFTPVAQLLVGLWFLHEHLTRARWIGFGIVWVALVVLTADSLVAAGRSRRRGPEPVASSSASGEL